MCDFALPSDFTDEQKKALLAASEFTFDIRWAEEKIRNGDYELWHDVKNFKSLGYETAESLELPNWAFNYFDFEKFGYDVAAEHHGTLTNYGWLVFK